MNLSHTVVASRTQPGDFATKEECALMVKNRHQEIFQADAERIGVAENKVIKVMVFRELHSDGNLHLYAAGL